MTEEETATPKGTSPGLLVDNPPPLGIRWNLVFIEAYHVGPFQKKKGCIKKVAHYGVMAPERRGGHLGFFPNQRSHRKLTTESTVS